MITLTWTLFRQPLMALAALAYLVIVGAKMNKMHSQILLPMGKMAQGWTMVRALPFQVQ